MKLSTVWCVVVFAFGIPACLAVQWTPSQPDQSVVQACLGDDVLFNWNYTLGDGETVEDIKWYHIGDRSNELIGVYTAGKFIVMPAFSGRVQLPGGAVLVLDNVTGSDEGNYSVDVSVHRESGTYDTIRSVASLQVSVRPPAGSLTVTQNRAAVVDDVTGELHVDISCGTFTDLGQPPVSVVWQTPSGDLLKSTSYADGRFHLLLENPVTGGNYTCRLSSDSHTAGCLPSSDPLRGQATLVVNEQIARLTLLEANQAALAKQNREDINHLEAQNAILTQHVHGLQNQNANLTQYVHQLEAQLGRYQQENSNLTGYIHTLESELSRLSAKADRHVSFHSRLTSDEHLTSTQPLLLQDVLSNDGGAYNAATGRFVVPYNGTYMFAATAGTASATNSNVNLYLMVDDQEVCWAHSARASDVEMSTCHVAQYFTQGQEVWLRGAGYFWFPGTVFSGALINSDQ